MKTIATFILAVMTFISARAYEYSYEFRDTPISDAIVAISKDHPDIDVSFIYKELDNYRTTVKIEADDAYDALRQAIGLNPVTVIKKGDQYYVEALQHGLYCYTGCAVDTDHEPVAAATVMLLAPSDSTVITYGITDAEGRFSIPCDSRGVIGKLTCLGFLTTMRRFDAFNVGTIVMHEKPVALKDVKIEAENAYLYSDKSVYLPTAQQKKASQTGADLLEHMAIPQLGLSTQSIVTNSGKPVAVFIDYIPATDDDLKAMRVADVRKVEFMEYPSDPRLQGNQYVINFIMQRYEYGGYVKALAHTNLVTNSVAEGLGNVRMQYKKMTYDLMGSTMYYDRSHMGSDLTETFRLPQADGEIKEFNRYSKMKSSRESEDWYYATFRATYNSDNVQAQSQVSGKIDRKPNTRRSGSVSYSPQAFPESEYTTLHNDRSRFLSYNGYYFFVLPRGNSLTITPSYRLSHTEQISTYTESGHDAIFNSASDNTNQFSGNLKFKHDFGRYGSLLALLKGSYEYNRTRYAGSAEALDRAKSSRIGAGLNYDLKSNSLYAHIGFGWDWDRLQFGDMTDKPSTPNFDLSLQYSIKEKHSVAASFGYSSWLPSPSFKSDKIIAASPLLSYTGNSNLVPAKSYDFDLSYTWVPNNNYSISAYAWAWMVGKRYVYDYEATATGVLRTIKQPMGSFAQGTFGISYALRFFDRNFVVSGNFGQILNHNGRPYNVNHSHLNWHVRLRYYLNDWNFTFTYVGPTESADGCMNGLWARTKSDWYITLGWSSDKWNIRGDIINFTRWHYFSSRINMKSKYYDTTESFINGSNRAFIQLAVTSTIGFGKKVERSNQPYVSGSASSGILK